MTSTSRQPDLNYTTALGRSKEKGLSMENIEKPIQDSVRLDRIIARMIKQYENMEETFREYCKAAIREGFSP